MPLLRELRPVFRHRRVEIEQPLVHEPVSARRDDPLRRGPNVDYAYRAPMAWYARHPYSPPQTIDDRLTVDDNGDSRADFVEPVKLPAKASFTPLKRSSHCPGYRVLSAWRPLPLRSVGAILAPSRRFGGTCDSDGVPRRKSKKGRDRRSRPSLPAAWPASYPVWRSAQRASALRLARRRPTLEAFTRAAKRPSGHSHHRPDTGLLLRVSASLTLPCRAD